MGDVLEEGAATESSGRSWLPIVKVAGGTFAASVVIDANDQRTVVGAGLQVEADSNGVACSIQAYVPLFVFPSSGSLRAALGTADGSLEISVDLSLPAPADPNAVSLAGLVLCAHPTAAGDPKFELTLRSLHLPAAHRRATCTSPSIGSPTSTTPCSDSCSGSCGRRWRPWRATTRSAAWRRCSGLGGTRSSPSRSTNWRRAVSPRSSTGSRRSSPTNRRGRRRPSVAIIDELAHTNAAGSRAPQALRGCRAPARERHRRLDDGQHPAPREPQQPHPRAHRRRGAETFPDRWLHEADEIRLVDLSPGSLRERIGRGLVYPADRVDAALQGFFTVENLTALRALVLHELAEVAAAELQTSSPGARPIERVLVAIDGRRDSYAYLVRTGARLARRSDSELYVLAVEPQDGRVNAETAAVLADAEALTRSLGGSFLRRRADNPAAEIIREAKAQRITQIVVGKSRRSP